MFTCEQNQNLQISVVWMIIHNKIFTKKSKRNSHRTTSLSTQIFRQRACVFANMWWAEIFYCDVIMGVMASQINSFSIVCSTVCSGTDQRKHQSSTQLAFVRGIHRWPVDSPHKTPVTSTMFPFDVIMRHASEHALRNFTELFSRDLMCFASLGGCASTT